MTCSRIVPPEQDLEPEMFGRIGRVATTRARLILLVAGLAVVLAGVVGIHAVSKLKSSGFVSPHAPSEIASNLLDQHFGGSPNLILLVQARSGTVDQPAVASTGRGITAAVAASPGVSGVTSYWTTDSTTLRSRSGTEALVLAHVAGNDTVLKNRTNAAIAAAGRVGGPLTVKAGGTSAANDAVGQQVTKDLGVAEAIAIPLTMVLLILAFGSVVAAGLPVAIGLIAIIATLAVLWIIGSITDVSVYALNLTTAMGLGLAIDYSLLMVNRYREELAAGRTVTDAVIRSVETAGRTILFSAATVAAAMAALLVFPVYFLRSFAYAGVSVIVIAALGALVVLPALLTVLGWRVNALRVPLPRRRRPTMASVESPFWRRVVTGVMRRPIAAGLPVVLILVIAGLPFLHVHFGTPDDRVLPTSAAARQVGDALRTQFRSDADDTLEIVTSRPLNPTESATYSARISTVAGVAMVTGPSGVWTDGAEVATGGPVALRHQGSTESWYTAIITPDSESGAAQALVHHVRAQPVATGTVSYVGGSAAALVDQKQDLGSRLPLALILIVLTTLIVLWLFTGSVVLPLKALVLNFLSLTAVFGAMVWIFQYGHGASILGFTPMPTSTTMPLLLFCIAFGLSMDYEVFVLSRIKELHDAGASNTDAVVGGLARTGRIVTTAAALLAVTFFAIASSKISFIQMFGIGTGVAILVDATLIRGVLVPSFMRLMGDANWWSPPLLRRWHDRLNLSDAPPDTAPRPAAESVPV
jgi:RND superfamily putative drug exporter